MSLGLVVEVIAKGDDCDEERDWQLNQKNVRTLATVGRRERKDGESMHVSIQTRYTISPSSYSFLFSVCFNTTPSLLTPEMLRPLPHSASNKQ
jgi:hypothetical protein